VYLPALVSAQERRGSLAGGCGDSVSLSSAILETPVLRFFLWRFGFQLYGGKERAGSFSRRDERRKEEQLRCQTVDIFMRDGSRRLVAR
jgi:hypothetical protein